MKTLEEKAEDYANRDDLITAYRGEGDFGYEAIEQAYMAGYNEANKWISVEDELPDHGGDDDILVKYSINDGRVFICVAKYDPDANYWHDPAPDYSYMGFRVTHWRQI